MTPEESERGGRLSGPVRAVRRDELTGNLTKLQLTLESSGKAPMIEGMAVRSIVRQLLLGLSDEEYKKLDDEIDLVMQTKASIAEKGTRCKDAGVRSQSDAVEGEGSAEQAAGSDPTGETAATAVCNMIPAVI